MGNYFFRSDGAQRLKILVEAALIYWLLIHKQVAPPTNLIARINEAVKSSSLQPWHVIALSLFAFRFVSHVPLLLDLHAPHRSLTSGQALRYSASYSRARRILTALDAGMLNTSRIRFKPLRDTMSILFGAFFLFNGRKAEDVLQRYQSQVTVGMVRTMWEKGTHPLLSLVAAASSPSLGIFGEPILSVREDGSIASSLLFYKRKARMLAKEDRVLLLVPGGGFIAMAPANHTQWAAQLAHDSDLPVLVIDYRKAPEHPYPAGMEDVFDCVYSTVGSCGAAAGLGVMRGKDCGNDDSLDGKEGVVRSWQRVLARNEKIREFAWENIQKSENAPSPCGRFFCDPKKNIDFNKVTLTPEQTRIVREMFLPEKYEFRTEIPAFRTQDTDPSGIRNWENSNPPNFRYGLLGDSAGGCLASTTLVRLIIIKQWYTRVSAYPTLQSAATTTTTINTTATALNASSQPTLASSQPSPAAVTPVTSTPVWPSTLTFAEQDFLAQHPPLPLPVSLHLIYPVLDVGTSFWRDREELVCEQEGALAAIALRESKRREEGGEHGGLEGGEGKGSVVETQDASVGHAENGERPVSGGQRVGGGVAMDDMRAKSSVVVEEVQDKTPQMENSSGQGTRKHSRREHSRKKDLGKINPRPISRPEASLESHNAGYIASIWTGNLTPNYSLMTTASTQSVPETATVLSETSVAPQSNCLPCAEAGLATDVSSGNATGMSSNTSSTSTPVAVTHKVRFTGDAASSAETPPSQPSHMHSTNTVANITTISEHISSTALGVGQVLSPLQRRMREDLIAAARRRQQQQQQQQLQQPADNADNGPTSKTAATTTTATTSSSRGSLQLQSPPPVVLSHPLALTRGQKSSAPSASASASFIALNSTSPLPLASPTPQFSTKALRAGDAVLPMQYQLLIAQSLCPKGGDPVADMYVSPLRAPDEVLEMFPPTVIHVGDCDPLEEDSQALFIRLSRLAAINAAKSHNSKLSTIATVSTNATNATVPTDASAAPNSAVSAACVSNAAVAASTAPPAVEWSSLSKIGAPNLHCHTDETGRNKLVVIRGVSHAYMNVFTLLPEGAQAMSMSAAWARDALGNRGWMGKQENPEPKKSFFFNLFGRESDAEQKLPLSTIHNVQGSDLRVKTSLQDLPHVEDGQVLAKL